jgi:hypothetical protein
MKVKIGRHELQARLRFMDTHGISLIQFGSVLIEPTYLARHGATIIEATPAEQTYLQAQRCPIEVVHPEAVEAGEGGCENLEFADLLRETDSAPSGSSEELQ